MSQLRPPAGGSGGGSAFRGAKAYRSTAQSIPNNTETALAFDAEDYDTDSIYDSGTSRFTLNKLGYWRITASVYFASNASGYRSFLLRKNGAFTRSRCLLNAASSGSHAVTITEIVSATAITDYVDAAVQQNSGGALNANADVTSMSVEWIGA